MGVSDSDCLKDNLSLVTPIPSPSSRRSAFAPIALTAAAAFTATVTHTNTTPDKIRQRKKIMVGVVLSGGPFGSTDLITQRGTDFSVDFAQAFGRDLGVEAGTVQAQPPNHMQPLQQGRVDVLAVVTELNPERAELLAHVPTPRYHIGGIMSIAQDSPVH